MGALRRYRIEIVQPRSDWASLFFEEVERLRPFLAPWVIAYEHIGSTSVPGLSGKPILDIAAAISRLEDARLLIARASEAGYFQIECAANDRYDLWRTGASDAPTHILHFMEMDSDAWRKPIAFRDALRNDPALVRDYASLKVRLAQQHEDDIRAYGRGKTTFIEGVIAGRTTK